MRNPIAFPPIKRHGLIGDRRTGALVAADGTLDWFCAPDFDDPPLFGSLLDPERGGFCRWGPNTDSLGEQRYLDDTALLTTTWPGLALTDLMAWPQTERHRGAEGQRIVIRRLRASQETTVVFALQPRRN